MATTNETMGAKRATGTSGWVILLIVVAAAGLGAWIYQLTQGMRVTGLSQQVVWALYIAAFFTAVGSGAGLLFLVGFSEYKALIPAEKRRLGLIAALAGMVSGGLLIMMDIGNPLQVWRLITAMRFSSMLTWDFWMLAIAGVVTLVYLFAAKKSGGNKLMGFLAMVAAVAVVVVEGWMLATQRARPMWGSGGTVVGFLIAALVGGLALWVLADDDEPEAAVKSWFRLALIASLVLAVAEVVTPLVGGSPRAAEEIRRLVLTGSAAPIFWFQILVGLVLPLVLLGDGPVSQGSSRAGAAGGAGGENLAAGRGSGDALAAAARGCIHVLLG